MSDDGKGFSSAIGRNLRFPPALGAILALCTAIEVFLIAGDFGLWPGARLRQTVYEWGGFWPGLLRDWRPNYPGQPWAMFLTHGFLHGGPVHLIVNMITLFSLGRGVIERVGQGRFLLLYFGSMLGGGVGFGMSETLAPMVGASGALFGLAGGILAWNYIDRFTLRAGLWPVARAALMLLVLNVVLWWAMDGLLAWQTHLGGFVAGWIAALLIDPRPRPPEGDTETRTESTGQARPEA